MEIITEEPSQRFCPYLEIKCQHLCPAWLDGLDDCMFHICLTEVRATFSIAAAYLDKHLNVEEGFGLETLTGLRSVITGEATAEQRQIVSSVIGSLVSSALMAKVAEMDVGQISSVLTQVEGHINFDLWEILGKKRS